MEQKQGRLQGNPKWKKEARYSWVPLNDSTYVFIPDDISYLKNDLIYDKLKELNQKMKDVGYVHETKYALFDLNKRKPCS